MGIMEPRPEMALACVGIGEVLEGMGWMLGRSRD